jgi:ubiquinone biosynthesis protein
LGVERLVPISPWRARLRSRLEEKSDAERLRLALGELGPTFIKLGQFLSTRADLLPPHFLSELRQLQDAAPPVPSEQIVEFLERELGKPYSKAFLSFDPKPLASASIGQVHAAVLLDGTPVTVKVRRPGIERTIDTDLGALADFVSLLHGRSASLRRYDLPAFLREFSLMLHDELLFTVEAHNTEALREALAPDPHVAVPRVFWDLTRTGVLTLERFSGTRVNQPDEMRAAGIDPRQVAVNLAQSMLRQVFQLGIFHGDPHQGNLVVMQDGRLGFLDMGEVGQLDQSTRRLMVDLIVAVVRNDADAALDVLLEVGATGPDTDVTGLRRDLARMIMRYAPLGRRQLPLGQFFQRLVTLLFHHGVRVPAEFTLLGKALLLTQGVCNELDPDFDAVAAAKPIIAEMELERASPRRFFSDMLEAAREVRRYAARIPRRADQILDDLRRGTLRLRTHEEDLERRLAHQAILINRLCGTILLGAIILGASIVVFSPSAPPWAALWIGVPALAIAALLAMLLLGNLLRRW